jgi:hypothetical protein
MLLLDDNKIQGTLKKVTQPTLDSFATNRTSSTHHPTAIMA